MACIFVLKDSGNDKLITKTTKLFVFFLCFQVTVGSWNAGKNNMGFGMDRVEWNVIKSCREVFEKYTSHAGSRYCRKLIFKM